MKRIYVFALGILSCLMSANAQEKLPVVDVAMDVRADFTYDDIEHQDSKSGIHGRYLNLMVNGNILPTLSYHWRQRLNKFGDYGNDVFAATDWIYLNWQATEHFSFAGGKQVVMIGGYEYDAAPIDIFFASIFWNNIACYQFGASATYTTTNKKHAFTFQACNSPYQKIGSSCYAYNLFWNGKMGAFTTLWSVNLIEYERGHYANFFALGNRLNLGPVDLQVDLMNRATSHHKYFFADYSVIGKVEYAVLPWMTIMLKGGHDKFEDMPGAPEHLDKSFYGGGLEFYPLKNKRDLRLHAVFHQAHDNDGVRTNELSIGLKWRVDLYKH